jgi:hypothetical protein
MFIRLNKTTQKTQTPQEENSMGKDKELRPQTNVFYTIPTKRPPLVSEVSANLCG